MSLLYSLVVVGQQAKHTNNDKDFIFYHYKKSQVLQRMNKLQVIESKHFLKAKKASRSYKEALKYYTVCKMEICNEGKKSILIA